ncbi:MULTISPECIES: alpha/beta hydrolase fold domain-containing protein [unclassified Streptomyces]|uniref:alpha/beta hydrolase fold domain-containing protein n=1 Tax=unclassified Streptomyces TaxID=2593676 RepID=UPI0033B407F3
MPLRPCISARLSRIKDLPSWPEALADPAVRLRLREHRTWEPAPALPSVGITDQSVPGPHGPVPAAVLGTDPARITVGGASAGANLAAGAVLRLRNDDGWLPATLVPACSVMHSVLPALSPPLAEAFAKLPRMVRILPEDMAATTGNYQGGATDPHGYALLAHGVLDGLCPTLLLDAEYDDLRASSEAFAAARQERPAKGQGPGEGE